MNRREFSRRKSSQPAMLSLSADFTKSWPMKIADISLIGMRLSGELPEKIECDQLYVRLAETNITINGRIVSRDEHGLRITFSLNDLQLAELVAHSDVYASLVLETIPD